MIDVARWRRTRALAIGASAGGVDALCQLLPALPASLHVPVFVVLHLPRDRPSLLVHVFQPKCALRVCEANDKAPIEAGCVYLAPPDYHMMIDEGPRIALSNEEEVWFSRPSIDVLFETASDYYREDLIAVILTGANEDGSAGLHAVHRRGGIAIVQQPIGAHSPAMLVSALKRSPNVHVLTLDEIAATFRDSDQWNRPKQENASPSPDLP